MEELIAGIKLFWRTVVTEEYCNSKINHVQNKVIHNVIRVHGKATELIIILITKYFFKI